MKWLRMLGSGVVLAITVVAGAIAFGNGTAPPPMRSVVDVARALDRTGMPPVTLHAARDGTALAHRAYLVPGSAQVALLFHGSSDSSIGMHGVARALQARGVTAYAVDVRGHGQSGPPGDIDYVGQLEHDVYDLVEHLRAVHRQASFVAIGHSSGGGFVLRLAGTESTAALFDKFVVTAPYLHHRAPTSRGAEGGGWVRPFKVRIAGLAALDALGIDLFAGLPVMAFALPADAPGTRTYSYRLFRNFGPHRDYVDDVRRAGRPVVVIVGAADEVFKADRYADALQDVRSLVDLRLIDGLGHMAMVADPRALAAITDAVLSLVP